ncbi:hypothetical protein G6321_00035980 [Bradyrhizobium barranii subsp. barranii]|uniref:Uncharacterized protein n=1 Tax=Bradyrhizobium barranii subsp. barranii TaxID=2823807 RepID=A0A7Z0QGG9_9BRAD|nr:hypothetical protein [Bradyrhizobium barranii]UGX91169.1 hypothetical protein G6321_00035980 [Bradyrhizobium barranii subsp. barranii]
MADNEQLVLSISTDTRAMQRQLDKLVGQVGTVDNSLGNAFTKAPKKIDDVTKSPGAAKFQTANLAARRPQPACLVRLSGLLRRQD